MKSILGLGTVLVGLGLVLACGATGDHDTGVEASAAPDTVGVEDSSVESALMTNGETLHDFDVAGTRYRISEVDGELLTSILYHRFAPIPSVVSADGEALTLLEMYLALQPDGVPDPRLVDAHVLQTEQLGRADAAIHRASLQLITSVEKTLADDCVNIAAPITGGTFAAPFYRKAGTISVTNGTFTAARTAAGERGQMILMACNTSPGAQTETVEFAKKTGAGAFVLQSTARIVANDAAFILRNPGITATRFDLRAKVTTFPNVPMNIGVFGEARP